MNDLPTHWTFSVASNGNLYYNVAGVIHVARRADGQFQTPEPLPPTINDGRANACPCVAPDESFLVFNRTLEHSDDLFVAFRGADGSWSTAGNLGDRVNAPDEHDMSPRLSSDGRYLFFISKHEEAGMYWVGTEVIEGLRSTAE